MDLDTLIIKIKIISNDSVIQTIVDKLQNWKKDDTSLDYLEYYIHKYIGDGSIEKNDAHETVYELWLLFQEEVTKDLDGMTMNERLYKFSLVKRYDSCFTKNCKLKVYTKLNASP